MQLNIKQTAYTNEVNVWVSTKAINGTRGLYAGFCFTRDAGKSFHVITALAWTYDGLRVASYDSRSADKSIVKFCERLAGVS